MFSMDGVLVSSIFIVLLVLMVGIFIAVKQKGNGHWSLLSDFIDLFFSPKKVKGKIGEKVTGCYLNRLGSDYVVYSDIVLPSNYGSTQIDHVVISPFGVFVIEVKNYQGFIYGNENSQNWTQNIYGNKYEFRNPIKQNTAHIIALKDVFHGLKTMPIYSIIAFGNDAKLNVNVDNIDIVYFHNLVKKIKEYNVVYNSKDDVLKYCLALENANIVDENLRSNHISNVKNHILERDLSIANCRCPECGGSLILRVGKYGNFYGCSNYPYCKFTYNIKQ